MENLETNAVTIAARSADALALANKLAITDDGSAMKAGAFLKMLKALQAEVKRDREDERISAKATLDAIVAGRNKHLLPLQQAETIVKTKQIAYEDAQIAKRKADQAELARQAREEMEAAEAQAMLEASALEEVGATEQAQAVREAPIEPIAPIILPQIKLDVQGQHTTVRWKVRLVDKEKIDRDLLAFDQVAANQAVQTIKNEYARDEAGGRPSRDNLKLAAINELPNLTVLTKEMIGVEVPGCEIYIEKSRASIS